MHCSMIEQNLSFCALQCAFWAASALFLSTSAASLDGRDCCCKPQLAVIGNWKFEQVYFEC